MRAYLPECTFAFFGEIVCLVAVLESRLHVLLRFRVMANALLATLHGGDVQRPRGRMPLPNVLLKLDVL